VHDISVPFDAGTPEWPGDTAFACGWAWQIASGASVNVSHLVMSPHVGTHADAPLHVRTGAAGADRLPLAPFLGRARVVDVSRVTGTISLADLREGGYTVETERLLLHTGRTVATGSFPATWPTLAPDAALTLARAGLKLLGVDAPSVDERESKTLAVHHALFDGGAYVLENLDLRGITPGEWELLALPMPMGAVDAAPVRALLRPR
jgi:arylformamidase